jgi:hypothetical protein
MSVSEKFKHDVYKGCGLLKLRLHSRAFKKHVGPTLDVHGAQATILLR